VSSFAEFARRGQRALSMPPRRVVQRLLEEAARKSRRPWDRIRPALLTDRALLAATGAASIDRLWMSRRETPFLLRDAPSAAARAFRARFPEGAGAVIAKAERTLRHEFDLLGSGPVIFDRQLPWRSDFKTGREWPRQYCHAIEYAELDRPTDVKVPWELSRFQHAVALGQAYWLSEDERYAQEFVDEVIDWIAENPYAYTINWSCAMDVALRAISWIWAFHFFADAKACADSSFRSAFLRSLFLHGEFVAANVERSDINGNHYLTDGVGLVFLGSFFRDAAVARGWLRAGRDIVADEIFIQVSPDGVDFEQSTAYHRLVLEAFCTAYLLLEAAGDTPPPPAWQRLERMFEFVQAYTKPDGHSPLVGDADDGRIQQLGPQALNDHRYLLSTGAAIFQRPDFRSAATRFFEESFWLLGTNGMERFDTLTDDAAAADSSRAFPAGGFYVMRGGGDHVFIDCGEVGMRGRGGHGHNDVLSFELMLDGLNVITDSGAYVYTASREWRNRFRSTAFHNVVQVDDEELNRFIGPDSMWTLHYDAVPADPVWLPGAEVDYFSGGHTGYQRLSAPVRCRREIVLDRRAHRAVVGDTLTSAAIHEYRWRFHFDSALDATALGDGVKVSCARGEAWLLPVLPLAIAIEDSWVSPSYGVKHPAKLAVFAERATDAARRWIVSRQWIAPGDREAYVQSVMNPCVKSS
jgi:hypothetical protein